MLVYFFKLYIMANAKVNVQQRATGRVGGTNSPVYALKSPGGKSPGKVNKPQPSPKMKMGGTKGKKC
jgi:hypothetical protein